MQKVASLIEWILEEGIPLVLAMVMIVWLFQASHSENLQVQMTARIIANVAALCGVTLLVIMLAVGIDKRSGGNLSYVWGAARQCAEESPTLFILVYVAFFLGTACLAELISF